MVVLTVFQVLNSNPGDWTFYGWFLVGTMNVILFGYRFFKPYLTIKDDYLFVHDFLNSSSIPLSEGTQIKRFAGEYILQQAGKKLKFDTQLIDETSLKTLDSELNKYNIKWV